MSFYLLEIGCEELPASFIGIACEHMENDTKNRMKNMHLSYSGITCGGTPRRLYLYVEGIPEKQEDRTETVQGPAAKIAFNPDGSLTQVGIKFLESKGLSPDSAKKTKTEKGEYLCASKEISGKDSSSIFTELITDVIKSIPFPKTMRWGDREIRFGRPVKYFMSMWNGVVLPLNIDGFEACDTTTGHRFFSPGRFKVASFEEYKDTLKNNHVILDVDDRIAEIKRQMRVLEESKGYTVDTDEVLMLTVANLVEWPFCIEGSFDKEFLELPDRVPITSMKIHQRYFPVYKDGKLQQFFIGVSNMEPDDPSLIRQGYERVIRARLNDAMFFYNNDKVIPLENRVEMLKKVVYQEKLGTSYEKMERFRELALYLAGELGLDNTDKELVTTAATLCKADLMCEMVFEFPELQGFMGNIYARIQKKPEVVAASIEEHYMPRFAGDLLPTGIIGKILALSDKLDTIAGAFAVGMIPSGNEDPYGLRRNAIGIINIIEEAGWNISMRELIKKAVELVAPKATADIGQTREKILMFFIQRQKQILMSRKEADADAVDAAIPLFDDIITMKKISQALTNAKKSEQFTALSEGFKRINNILRKAEHTVIRVEQSLLTEPREKELYAVYLRKKDEISSLTASGQWTDALNELSLFAGPLNDFFENVMVMADDPAVRNNRLSMLAALHALFISAGDLSKIIQ